MFQVGKIYYMNYTRAHHDRNPFLFVLYSDIRYTHGINIHYIGSIQQIQFSNMISKLQKAGLMYSGKLLYATIKTYIPQILGQGLGYHGPRGGVTNPQYTSYRTYFTTFLSGVEVHPGVNKFPNALYDAYQKAMEKILQNSMLKKQSQNDHTVVNFLGALPQRKILMERMREYSSRFTHLFKSPAVLDQQNQTLNQPPSNTPETQPEGGQTLGGGIPPATPPI